MNQRKLVQEVWDKGIIHRMLGINPSTLVSDPEPASKHRSSSKRTREGEDSVRSAWEEADAGLDADGPHNKWRAAARMKPRSLTDRLRWP